MEFPIDLKEYKPTLFSVSERLTAAKQKQLVKNIQLIRDSIVFMTAYANAKGLGGHTGGAYDIVPEMLIVDGFMRNGLVYPKRFDEAGHRVAIQYLMAVLDNKMQIRDLLHYREYKSGLPGHPELDEEKGIMFSSGRLGHLWGHVNGVAEQNPDKKIVLFGSDGSQMEGNDAEAARYAVAHNLNILLLIDDNNVTIEGHPKEYMHGFDIAQTLKGHGLKVETVDGQNIDDLFSEIQSGVSYKGQIAIVCKRIMAKGVEGIEGSTKAHDAIPIEYGIAYLEKRGYREAVEMLKCQKFSTSFKLVAESQSPSVRRKISEHAQEPPELTNDSNILPVSDWRFLTGVKKEIKQITCLGSSKEFARNRSEFGKVICEILEKMSNEERKKVLVISNDLGGSCGIDIIGKKFPQIYRMGGVMERNNFLTAAGFGSKEGYQGIFATFSAFLEMVISEITMSRLNKANVFAHFSHAGVDEIADNTCHFGINNFFADNGLEETKLFFPADANQMRAIVKEIFHLSGLRFVFSTRSEVPYILDEKGDHFFGEEYKFEIGKDEVIREGKRGYVISYGEMLYRALHAVEELKKKRIDVGLINKPTLDVIDEEMMKKLGKAGFVLVVESQNIKTGLGIRFGTWLLERGYKVKYNHIGTYRGGEGGVKEQIGHQGLDAEGIKKCVKEIINVSEL